MAVAMGCHLGLLVALLRPATPSTDKMPVSEGRSAAMRLRFIASARPASVLSAPRPAPPVPVASSKTHASKAALPDKPIPVVNSATGPVPATSPTRPLVLTLPKAVASPSTPGADSPNAQRQIATGDSDFAERLLKAQHAHDVHGIPGSDRRLAPGIQLIDPRDQGVAAVVRKAQRLFGIPDRHCIDVDAWQQLSTEELVARHLSPADVKRDAERYGCHQPLGLHF